MRRVKPSPLNQACWITTLILSLVFAQFAGLQHRIEHANWQGNPAIGKLDFRHLSDSRVTALADNSKKTNEHSCAVFDAATLADTSYATPCAVVFADNENFPPQSVLPTSWQAPFVHPFHSRAPPAVTI